MLDLSAEMAQLWASLGPAPSGRARTIQFVAAHRGAGASTFAREFARYAATQAHKPVWLIDVDLNGPGQTEAIRSQPQRYGRLGQAAAASPDGSVFFAVEPRAKGPDGGPVPDSRYLSAHQSGRSRLWVTRFRRDALRGPQRARILPHAPYWNALKPHAETIVVDAPAADRSQDYLLLAPSMDLTILVVAADEPDAAAAGAMKLAIEQAGGRCAGVVVNRAEPQPMRAMR